MPFQEKRRLRARLEAAQTYQEWREAASQLDR